MRKTSMMIFHNPLCTWQLWLAFVKMKIKLISLIKQQLVWLSKLALLQAKLVCFFSRTFIKFPAGCASWTLYWGQHYYCFLRSLHSSLIQFACLQFMTVPWSLLSLSHFLSCSSFLHVPCLPFFWPLCVLVLDAYITTYWFDRWMWI